MTTETVDLNGIKVVSDKAEKQVFRDFIYSHYASDTHFIAPLKLDQSMNINPTKNPFYKHAEFELFLAEKNDKIVGRVAAVIDHRYNEHHKTKVGYFAFFECIDDPRVSNLLLRVVNDWLKERGMEYIQGPTAPGMMDVIGFLVEGFNVDPAIMMPYTKPYYPKLMESAGMEGIMDLLAYRVTKESVNFERIKRVEPLLRKKLGDLQVRNLNMRKLKKEVPLIVDMYNKAWEKNWGYTPLSEEDFMLLAKSMKPILDPDLALIAEVSGKPVGFFIAIPDLNQVLKKMDGTLFPTGIFKLLYNIRKIKDLRLALMGVVPEYQGKGVDALMQMQIIERGLAKGYQTAEMSWVLESNIDMCRVAERTGAFIEKRYRMYGKKIS